jgi:adenosylhomocysteine nucleosidase
MSMPIAIIAALPREIAALVRGAKADAEWLKLGVWLYWVDGAVVVAAGMGAERAAMAVEAALVVSDARTLISTGLAGGCAPEVAAGSVVEAGVVVDAKTGERFAAAEDAAGVTLATAKAIASVREKARLAERYGAMLVDMEATTVARIAREKGLEFRAS